MADDELLVTISGPAFSLLLYENRRIMDQIGFFLGEILVYVTKKVTDKDREIEHTKYHIDIKSIVAYPVGEPFFNSFGHIERIKLEKLLGERVNNVVGWYHFREEFPKMIPSFRDRNIHCELTKFFTSKNSLLIEKNFLFCILTSSVSEIGGTHKFKHQLLRHERAAYKPVSLKINNLGADASRADGSDYKPKPTYSSEYNAFSNVYTRMRKDLKNVSGVEAVTMIQEAADNLLQELIPHISKSDQYVSELENQVMVLRDEYFRKQFEHRKLQEKMEQMDLDIASDSQPKSPETLQLQDIEKSPESSGSSVKQTIKDFENRDRTCNLSTDRNNTLTKGSRGSQSTNTDQSKLKKSKPAVQFISDSAAASTRSKTSQPKSRSNSPTLFDSDS